MMCRQMHSIIHIIIRILIESSFCVFNSMLPASRSNFPEVAANYGKGRAGLM